jgi:hypothetical protein
MHDQLRLTKTQHWLSQPHPLSISQQTTTNNSQIKHAVAAVKTPESDQWVSGGALREKEQKGVKGARE